MTWFAVCDEYCSAEGTERDGEAVWTVSRDPNITGWETDSGCSGYGLTRKDAEFLAKAANYYEEHVPAEQQEPPLIILGVR